MKLSSRNSIKYPTDALDRPNHRVLAAMVLVGVLAMTTSDARAQFRLDIRDVAESAFKDQLETDTAPVAVNNVRRGARVVLMKPEQFERFLFRRQPEDQALTALNQRLDDKLKWFQENGDFNQDKLEKIRLAGQGDIAALMFRFEQLRAEFKDNMQDQADLMRMVQKAQPLQRELLQGQIFGPTSIFARVSNQLMEAEEKADHAKHEKRKLRLFFAGAVDSAIAKLARACRLQGNQRKEIRDLLMVDEALPPIKNFSTRNGGGKYMVTYALYQLARRKFELAGILSDAQMRAVEPLLATAMQRKDTLRREGYLK